MGRIVRLSHSLGLGQAKHIGCIGPNAYFQNRNDLENIVPGSEKMPSPHNYC